MAAEAEDGATTTRLAEQEPWPAEEEGAERADRLERERLADVDIVNAELERIVRKKLAAEAEEARAEAEISERERRAAAETTNGAPESDDADLSASSFPSVALIGSSGGGTATLGHTDPVELITTIHRELRRVRDAERDDQGRRRACRGISHAIFVSLCDGTGFDSVREQDWLPAEDERGDGGGPLAALYSVGLTDRDVTHAPFRVTLVERGPLSRINRLARNLDVKLSHAIRAATGGDGISAIISLSSEPTTIHAASLGACRQMHCTDLPVVGSGGTSLSHIASNFDLRIVGNSGGSVASTTLTKARGWATGLAEEWDMTYDANGAPAIRAKGGPPTDGQQKEDPKKTPIPTLRSIMEAALPAFLFVCIALRLLNTGGQGGDHEACSWDQQDEREQHDPASFVIYALRHIVLGTACCVLAATSRSSSLSTASSSADAVSPIGDQSTLIMSATIAGVLASASASRSALSSPSLGGGGALAGLVAGALLPLVLANVSALCLRFRLTATMTNILCGGGVGLCVGTVMHVSGLAHGLAVCTGALRSLLRWRRLVVPDAASSFGVIPVLQYSQEHWSAVMSRFPAVLHASPFFQVQDCSPGFLPVPIGVGFLYGCIFVYGSKIGLYHSLFLPAILLEMDSAEEASLLGAVDECSLVLVCAGICVGNLVLPPAAQRKNPREKNRKSGAATLSWQALKTNILCGDFIEAAYPSMERSKIINGSAYVAAGLSTEILLQRRVLSTAYLPLPMAIWISNDGWGMSIACMVAFVVSLFGTLISNATSDHR